MLMYIYAIISSNAYLRSVAAVSSFAECFLKANEYLLRISDTVKGITLIGDAFMSIVALFVTISQSNVLSRLYNQM